MTANQNTAWRRLGVQAILGVSLLAAPALAGNPPPNEAWNDRFVGEAYWSYTVSVGSRGTQIFNDTGLNDRKTRLYAGSSTPVWQASDPATCFSRSVASSKDSDVHAAIRQTVIAGVSGYRAVLDVYRPGSSSPVFSYTFSQPLTGVGTNFCGVSDDGSWVAAAVTHSFTTYLLFRNLDTGQEIESSISIFGSAKTFALSADASRIYLGGTNSAVVIDVATGATLLDASVAGARIRGHSLSRDGSTVVVPKSGKLRVFKDYGAGFSGQTDYLVPNATGNEIAWVTGTSADGGVIIGAFVISPAAVSHRVVAWDTATGAVLLDQAFNGSGSYDNLPSDVVVSDSGSRIVVSSQGDEANLTPEIMVYDRAPDGTYSLAATFDRAGAVLDMDISTDGNHLAIIERTTHINSITGDQVVSAFDLGGDLFMRGVPVAGAPLTFDFYPESGPVNSLLVATTQASTPLPLGATGTLYLNRMDLQPLVPMSGTDSTGKSSVAYTIPSSWSGTTIYVQGFSNWPRRLSECWFPVVIP